MIKVVQPRVLRPQTTEQREVIAAVDAACSSCGSEDGAACAAMEEHEIASGANVIVIS